LAGGDGEALVGGVVVLGDAVALGDAVVLGDVVALGFCDELHAAMDSAAAPVTARIASRVSRDVGELVDINASPIVSGSRRSGLPAGAVRRMCVAMY
jgi:hypothetical protein